MGAIVDIQIQHLEKLLKDREITLNLDASAREWLADRGYDPIYGARPLKRGDSETGERPVIDDDP